MTVIHVPTSSGREILLDDELDGMKVVHAHCYCQPEIGDLVAMCGLKHWVAGIAPSPGDKRCQVCVDTMICPVCGADFS